MSTRAYKFRFYPCEEQRVLLARTFGCVRSVYNRTLRYRTDAYRDEGTSIGYTGANAYLTGMKRDEDLAWLREVSCVPLQQCLRHQQKAFTNFFEGRAGYPNFKSKHRRQSAEFTRSGFTYPDGQILLAKCKIPLDVCWSQPLPCEPSTITVSMDTLGRYFVSCLCEVEPVPLPLNPTSVGLDLGLTHLVTLSTGEKIDNPRHTARFAARLARAQRRLARKRKGSANRARAKRCVARIHARIGDARQDYLHKLSRRLIRQNGIVCIESLAVKNMIRNRSLSKAISDAGWSELVRQLRYKGRWAGRQVVSIDRFYPSSKRCSGCGHTVEQMPLGVRTWTCPACSVTHDRDINAAINIKAAGLAVLACGGDVSPAA